MDDKKLDEALEKVESSPKHRDPQDRLEVESACKSWSSTIQHMLDGRFGKGKVVHILIIAPTGREATLSWISTANFQSVKAAIEALQERLKYLEEQRLVIPPEHFGG
jgi:hypothetical protein